MADQDPNGVRGREGGKAAEEALIQAAKLEELQRLKAAEEVLDLRHRRRERSSRWLAMSQALVGYIALAGFFANAYQNYVNKQEQEDVRRQEQARWSLEFKRAQDADKHRAFFETSLLATDKDNDDKRLVGYALLHEFVSDPDFNFKATLMLEESLAQELKRNKLEVGLAESVRAQIVAIVTALSQTKECDKLQRAALSIDRVAQRQVRFQDAVETGEVFRVYVRRLVGRAAMVCGSLQEFRAVRRPIRDTLMRLPELGELPGKVSQAAANQRLAELLRDRCDAEIEMSGATDCREIYQSYAKLCDEPEAPVSALAAPRPPGKDSGQDRRERKSADGGVLPGSTGAAAAPRKVDQDRRQEDGACAVVKNAVARMASAAASGTPAQPDD